MTDFLTVPFFEIVFLAGAGCLFGGGSLLSRGSGLLGGGSLLRGRGLFGLFGGGDLFRCGLLGYLLFLHLRYDLLRLRSGLLCLGA